jgi:error-prone DNA polymerase
MSEPEITLADLWATGVSPERHPVEHLREDLRRAGVRSVADLATTESGRRVHVGGLVTHRQRPGTAMGVTFLNLEDETGMLNVVCSVGLMRAQRQAARNKVAVVIRGRLERNEGVTNLIADRVEGIDVIVPGAGAVLQARASSRDFR